MDSSDIVIMPKPDSISWEEITELLHIAFAEHAKNGLNYSASFQDKKTTQERVGDGVCLVAVLGDQLVATRTFRIINKVIYTSQLAVHPDYRGRGITVKLEDYILNYARANNIVALKCDTSERAKTIINLHIKAGWQKVGLASGQTTNYYSIVFRKPVCGRRYTALEAGIRFYLSSCFWRLMLTEHGKIRKLSKPFYLLARKIYRIVR